MNQGREAQLDALFRRHLDDVLRTCLRFAAGDRQWALDRTQDVFVRLAEELPSLRDVDDLGGWLYRVATNACLMALRRERGWRRVADRLMQALPGRAPSAERQARAERDVSAVEADIAALPARERAVMSLVYFDGKSQSEVAAVLGMSKGQISKLHSRALAKLKARDWEVGRD